MELHPGAGEHTIAGEHTVVIRTHDTHKKTAGCCIFTMHILSSLLCSLGMLDFRTCSVVAGVAVAVAVAPAVLGCLLLFLLSGCSGCWFLYSDPMDRPATPRG